MFFKKKLFTMKEGLELGEVLQRSRRNFPTLIYLKDPPRGIFSFGNLEETVKILTLKPVELEGNCVNVVVSQQTLDFVLALFLSKVAHDRVM
ncbi:hypothetical protein OAF54_00935 [bacterium]|nr:hypothetical protein [bacterium]